MKNELKLQNLLNRISENGDEAAFKDLFDLFADGLYRFAFSILKNKQLAEETVSDVFFRIWMRRTSIAKIENFKPYIFTSARNAALNYIAKEKRNNMVWIEDVKVPLLMEDISPETELITRELRDAIAQAIDNLPERCKLIYSLAKIEQLKYKEISSILGISVKTIDHQLTIAIKKIGTEIENYLRDEGEPSGVSLILCLFVPNRK